MAYEFGGAYGGGGTPSPDETDYHFGLTLEEWARDKPLSILQLDPADRAVLRIAGEQMFPTPLQLFIPNPRLLLTCAQPMSQVN